MPFVLVRAMAGAQVTNIHCRVIPGLSFKQFQRTYDNLYRSIKASGGCEAVVSVNTAGPNAASTSELRYARNTLMLRHAEENILLESQ